MANLNRLFAEIFCLLFLESFFASGMRHLVYWDKKMIPPLSRDGLEITLEINDWMDVLCPYYANLEPSDQMLGRNEYIYLYNVTENEFMNCDTRRGNRVQDCDDPYTEKKLTTKFQERSPSPFGFTFRPGATYYYVSKTMHEGNSVGCSSTTLKMIVHVKRKGTVFLPDDTDTVKVYHEIEQKKLELTRPIATTTSSANFKHPRRHHHHGHKAKDSATQQPIPQKPIFKIQAAPRRNDNKAKASKNSQSDPENFAAGLMRASCPLTSLFVALASVLYIFYVAR